MITGKYAVVLSRNARGTGAILETPETFSRSLFFDNRPSH